MSKLNICKATRKIAADSLFIALRRLLSKDKPISEVNLRDRWLLEMRKHKEILRSSSWENICNLISKKRKFLNEIEKLKVTSGMAFTIEPRPWTKNDPKIPMVWFHTIAVFKENGKKELLTDFDDLFKLVGMDYMVGV